MYLIEWRLHIPFRRWLRSTIPVDYVLGLAKLWFMGSI
ncbi:MAG: hypothetical protein ACJASY_000683 [Halioglobus sp.]|jgi:hypothetical protein